MEAVVIEVIEVVNLISISPYPRGKQSFLAGQTAKEVDRGQRRRKEGMAIAGVEVPGKRGRGHPAARWPSATVGMEQ